jgi:uncharacterized protein (DUF1778 family)
MKVAEIRITEAILFKLGLLSLVNFRAREYNKETTETFLEHERIEFSQRAQVQFAEILLRPPQSNETMAKALKKRLGSIEKVTAILKG